MEVNSGLPKEFAELLVKFGVGKRSVHDEFFNSNPNLAELTQKIGITEIKCDSSLQTTKNLKCTIPNCSATFGGLVEFETHYNIAHRYTCCECKKHLPSPHFLDLHVAENHDSFFAVLAEKSPSYQCYLESCKLKFQNPKERKEHCINEHKFPPNFRFDHAPPKPKAKKPTNDTLDKSAQFSFCNSKVKSLPTNKFYMKNERKNRKSKLDSDDMLVEMKESLPDC